MSDAMLDALVLAAFLMLNVVFTLGNQKLGWFRPMLSLGFTVYLYWDTYHRTEISYGNTAAAVLGIGAAMLASPWMMRHMRVYTKPEEQNRTYTRAGWPYFRIWLVALAGNTVFLLVYENVAWFSRAFGRLMSATGLDLDGVAAFFVLCTMTMVGYRSIACMRRGYLLSSAAAESASGTTESEDTELEATESESAATGSETAGSETAGSEPEPRPRSRSTESDEPAEPGDDAADGDVRSEIVRSEDVPTSAPS